VADSPALAKAISLKAMWFAMRVDIRRRYEKRRMDYEIFNRQWLADLHFITAKLIARRIPVS
jgi:hypothetical protein